MTTASFMNSDGWIEKYPKVSHARVLRIGVPKNVVYNNKHNAKK
jgi:hypothetical protein